MPNISIALDGPAGSGKSTIAKQIAKLKNLLYVDTGAMYRAVTLKVLNEGIQIDDITKIKEVINGIQLDIDKDQILLDGKIVTDDIRKPEINRYVSLIARIPFVRIKMVDLQRKIALNKDVIMDGRDIGTYVLPNATYKFYITASLEERAKRRFEELSLKGFHVSFREVKEEIKMRDKIDSERNVSPLKKAPDAILIDTTGKSIGDVVQEILFYIK